MTDTRSSASGGSFSNGNRAVTAMFDSRSDAEEAVEALVEAGFSRGDVRLVPGQEKDTDATASGSSSGLTGTSTGSWSGSDTSYRGHEEGRGFWESLSDFFFPDEDRHSYAEGLRRGAYLVSVNTTEANYDQAVDILDDEGTIDLDEREGQWRTQGWAGYGSSDTGVASGSGGSGSATGTSRGSAREDEEIIPIAEEELNVGKREVDGGRVRVRSYVVEKPVEQQIALRRETVDVQRRQVDRPVSGEDPFRERTVELEERSEQPVVSKDVRVREELVLRKDVKTENKTISDTVRRTEVEVDDERKLNQSKRDQ